MNNHILLIILLCFNASISYSQNLQDGLKAYYTFDYTLEDASIYDNDLKLINGDLNYSNSLDSDSVLILNGETRINSITNLDISDYDEISISLWFRTTSITNDLQIILQGAYIGFGIYIAPNTGKIMGFFDGSSTNALESTKVLTDGLWHHVLLQHDGIKTSMFIDGELDGTLVEPLTKGNGELYIGKSRLNLKPYTGEIEEIRIYNRILNEDEISTLQEKAVLDLSNFVLFPVPTNSILYFDTENNYDYKIYNVLGMLLKEGNGNRVDVSTFAEGTYIICINNQFSKRFIKVDN